MDEKRTALITNDAVVLGILLSILAIIFYTSTSRHRAFTRFYKFVPSILLCYFIPALLNTFNVISGSTSGIYTVATRYFLPASLVLLTLGIDIPALSKLGGKAVAVFLAGSFGVMIGGPMALYAVGSISPGVLSVNGEESWRGLATIAGSWIGGGANQAAMLEVFGASKNLFSLAVVVDVMVAYIWMALLLYGAQHTNKINRWLKADNSAIAELEEKMKAFGKTQRNQPRGTREWIILLGVAFGVVAVSHALSDVLVSWFTQNFPGSARYSLTSAFFWLIILATTAGLILSFTRARKLETYGASDIGSVFLYFIVASIGMQMDLKALAASPAIFWVAAVWILFHIAFTLLVAKLMKAPYFFVAVGSQANIGGPVSAPIVASAFNKHLAPIGVMMAILGYAVGTYLAYLCGLGLQYVSDGMR